MTVTAGNKRPTTCRAQPRGDRGFRRGLPRARGRGCCSRSRCCASCRASFSIPPIDRDEARFAQATKQMVESGDYVDIRFQDEVRYKKPVGIYWLQAGVVKAASALGYKGAVTTIWLYRVPSLIGAIGAVLLTYWTALAFVPRRAALLAGLMMASCVLLGFEAALRQDRRHVADDRGRRDGGDGACLSFGAGRTAPAACGERPGWCPAVFWTALAAGVLLKGPVIVMIVGLAALALVAVDRSAALVSCAQAACRHRLVRTPGAAMVPRHHWTGRRRVLRRIRRAGPAEQAVCRPGIPWCAARILFRLVLVHVLAGCDAGGPGDAGGLGGPPRAGRPSSCWPGSCHHGSFSSW